MTFNGVTKSPLITLEDPLGGITAIWMMPFNETDLNFGIIMVPQLRYTDNTEYGTMEDLENIPYKWQKAKTRKMRVMMDLVDTHLRYIHWFVDAR